MESINVYGCTNFDNNLDLEFEERKNYDEDIDSHIVLKCVYKLSCVKFSTVQKKKLQTKVKPEFSSEIELYMKILQGSPILF